MAQGLQTLLDPLVCGTDFAYVFHIKDEPQETAININGFALSWMLKRRLADADIAAVVTKTTGGGGIGIGGTFNATPGSNTQRATVTIEDTDTDTVVPGVYYWELKRTDASLETRLAYGRVTLARAVHRA